MESSASGYVHAPAGSELNRLAVSATNHCLTGCAIGEFLGMAIATPLAGATGPRSPRRRLLSLVRMYRGWVPTGPVGPPGLGGRGSSEPPGPAQLAPEVISHCRAGQANRKRW
jgi:hypothetical protein